MLFIKRDFIYKTISKNKDSLKKLIYFNKWFDYHFSYSINFFGICPENTLKQIPKSILTQFFILSVGEHEFKKVIQIIKSHSELNENLINNIISLYKTKKITKLKTIKKFINIFTNMHKNNSEYEFNYDYLVSSFLNENKQEIEEKYNINKNILYKKNDYIYSLASKLKIYYNNNNINIKNINNEYEKIVFTPLFNKLLDTIHFSICTGTSLVIEGFQGEGKKSAIKYVSILLNYKIKNIFISPFFTLNDFMDNIDIYLNEAKNIKNIIFVCHINEPETRDLSKLSEIVNYFQEKSCIFIIIINKKCAFSQIDLINFDDKRLFEDYFFPIFLCTKTEHIYNYSKIISQKYNSTFLSNYSEEKMAIIRNIYSLNDIEKYTKLKNNFDLDNNTIENIIISKKNINLMNVNKDLSKKSELSPIDSLKWEFIILNESESSIKINNKFFLFKRDNSLMKSLNNLSTEQKRSFIILFIAYYSNLPCILQGPNGVGKSHLVKLLAKLLGKKLTLFPSIGCKRNYKFNNQKYFKDFSSKEKKEIITILNEINGNKKDEYISDVNEIYSKLIKNEKLSKGQIAQLQNLETKYSLESRFEIKNSELLELTKNDNIILLEGNASYLFSSFHYLFDIFYNETELISNKKFHLFISNDNQINNSNLNEFDLFDPFLACDLKYLFYKNNKSIYELIYGFLKNLDNLESQIDVSFLSLILTNLNILIYEKIINQNFNKRMFFSYWENISFKNMNIKNLVHEFFNNFLIYYFPNSDEKQREKYFEIIRENIKEKTLENNILEDNNNNNIYQNKKSLIEESLREFENNSKKKYDPDKYKFSEENKDLKMKNNNDINVDISKLKKIESKKYCPITYKIIDSYEGDNLIQEYTIYLNNNQNEVYILKKIKLTLIKIDKIKIEIEKYKSLNSVYLNPIKSFFVECDEFENELFCVLMEKNKKIKPLLEKFSANSNNIYWLIFIKIIFEINSLNSKGILLDNLNLNNLYFDDDNNIKFDIFTFLSKSIYTNNKSKLECGSLVYDLFLQLFGNDLNYINNNISIKEILFEDFFAKKCFELNLFDLIFSKDNNELFSFYFNSLFQNFNIENLSFDLYDFSCSECKILPELILKNMENLIFRCEKCFVVKSKNIQSFREHITSKKIINIKNKIFLKNNCIQFLQQFYQNLNNKYLYVKNIISQLNEANKNNNLEKNIFNDIMLDIMRNYFNNLRICNNLIYLYLNIFYILESSNIVINIKIEKQYENILEAINKYFSEKEISQFKQIINELKEKFYILYSGLSEKEINKLKLISKDFFNPFNQDISDLEKNNKFIEKNILFSSSLKKYNTFEEINNPENYMNINEELNNISNIMATSYDQTNRHFALVLLSKCAEQIGIKVKVLKSEDKNIPNIELISLQSLLCFGNQSKYQLHFNFEEKINQLILENEKYQMEFIQNLKFKLSNKLNIEQKNLILTNVHPGSVILDFYTDNLTNENEEKLELLINDKELCLKEIKKKVLIEALLISPKLLSPLGDRFSGWDKNAKRGGEEYIPPVKDWLGFGLNVLGKYDHGNDTWLDYRNLKGEFAIGYIGLDNFNKENIDFSNVCSKKLFKFKKEKLFREKKNVRDRGFFNFFSKKKCGDGVCVFQNPDDAENFAGIIEINKIRIKMILMCRVNSKKIRQPEDFENIWILNPNHDEIRPYRILIKKIPISPFTGALNDTLITSLVPINYIIQAINSKDNSFQSSGYITQKKYNYYSNGAKIENKDFVVIRFYTGEYYSYLNNYLRSKNINFFEENELISWIYCLQLALKRNKNVKNNTKVYRGVTRKFPHEIIEGSRFYLREFLSCSLNKKKAEEFLKSFGTMMEITIKNNEKNNYCFSVRDISLIPEEDEILISSHCHYVVEKIQRSNNVDYIWLTCEGYFNFKIKNGDILII